MGRWPPLQLHLSVSSQTRTVVMSRKGRRSQGLGPQTVKEVVTTARHPEANTGRQRGTAQCVRWKEAKGGSSETPTVAPLNSSDPLPAFHT